MPDKSSTQTYTKVMLRRQATGHAKEVTEWLLNHRIWKELSILYYAFSGVGPALSPNVLSLVGKNYDQDYVYFADSQDAKSGGSYQQSSFYLKAKVITKSFCQTNLAAVKSKFGKEEEVTYFSINSFPVTVRYNRPFSIEGACNNI